MILLNMQNLKNNANESIHKTEADSQTENKLRVTKGERGEEYIRNMGLTDTNYYTYNR